MQQAKFWIAKLRARSLNAGSHRPCSSDDEGAGDRGQPIWPLGVVISFCKDIGARRQANRVPLPVGIGFIDGVDEALNVSRATMKGVGLDPGGACQSEPEDRHRRYSPRDTPPTPPPFDHTGILLQLLRLPF
jgi:hypothetical protein